MLFQLYDQTWVPVSSKVRPGGGAMMEACPVEWFSAVPFYLSGKQR